MHGKTRAGKYSTISKFGTRSQISSNSHTWKPRIAQGSRGEKEEGEHQEAQVPKAQLGGEREGNHYVWSLSPSLAATMASGSDASIDKAVKKISKKRTVERRDVYEVIKITSQVNVAGQLTAQYNLLSTPSSVSAYVEAVTAMETAAAKNGFSDVEIAVFQASGAGDRAGMVMASVQAPSTQRLGDFLSQRNSGWMAEAMKDFPSLRKSEHDCLLNCEVIHSN